MDIAEAHQRVADAGVVIGWGGWLFSHLVDINLVLQTILLVASIVATVVAIIYHARRMSK
jgi:hypothetical protein